MPLTGLKSNKILNLFELSHVRQISALPSDRCWWTNRHVSRDSLLTVYKAFVGPHLDYRDILYDKSRKHLIHAKNWIYSVQCSGKSREKLYYELGLENLADRRFCRRLCSFYNFINGTSYSYLLQIVPDHNPSTHSLR